MVCSWTDKKFSCREKVKSCFEWSSIRLVRRNQWGTTGSVLGPISFNTYVSDMPSVVNSSILQFPDDVKMFRTIKLFNDFTQFQQDINLLAEWVSKWQLKFNVSNCNWLRQHEFSAYTIGGTVIASCNVVRDLGIQIDSHLKFREHTTAVTKKFNQLLSIGYS